MRRVQLVKLFILSTLILSALSVQSKSSVYDNNSWGNEYRLNSDTDVFLYSNSEISVYRINKYKKVYCNKDVFYISNNRVFCWYIFNQKENPISGWIDLEKLKND